MNASIAGTSVQHRHGPMRSSVGGTGTGTGGSNSGGKGGGGSGAGFAASNAGFDVRRKSSFGGKGGTWTLDPDPLISIEHRTPNPRP